MQKTSKVLSRGRKRREERENKLHGASLFSCSFALRGSRRLTKEKKWKNHFFFFFFRERFRFESYRHAPRRTSSASHASSSFSSESIGNSTEIALPGSESSVRTLGQVRFFSLLSFSRSHQFFSFDLLVLNLFFPSFFLSSNSPKNSFGGRSPERVASDALRTLFTFAAAKIILAQLEGSGRGGLAAYDKKGYDDLSAALARFNEPAAPPGRAESCGGEEEEDEEEEEEEEEARRSRTSRETSTCSPSSSSSSSAAPPKKSAFGGGKGDLWLAELSRKNPALALRVMEVRAAYAAEDFEWDQCRRLATEGLAEANLDILKARLGSAWDAAASDEEEEGGGREGEGM
jgi:hypothetical protein